MSKKLLKPVSLFVAVTMCVSLIATNVFAEHENKVYDGVTYVYDEERECYVKEDTGEILIDRETIMYNYNALPSDGGSYILGEDVAVEKGIVLGGDYSLDLNGHVLEYSNQNRDYLFTTNGTYFSLGNSGGDGAVVNTNTAPLLKATGSGSYNTVNVNIGTHVNGGCDLIRPYYKSLVYLEKGANCNIGEGGILEKGSSSQGGAIYVADYESSVFLFLGSTIENCRANEGGAIYTYGKVTLSHGGTSLINNYSSDKGGAVYVAGNGCLYLNAGNITGNSCGTDKGGAIYISKTAPGEDEESLGGVYIAGSSNIVISGNKSTSDNSENNVYIPDSSCEYNCVEIGINSFDSTSKIGISAGPNVSSIFKFDEYVSNYDISSFYSDDPDKVIYSVDGDAVLTDKKDSILIEGYQLLIYDGYVGIRFYFYIDSEKVNVEKAQLNIKAIGFVADNSVNGLQQFGDGFGNLIEVGQDFYFDNILSRKFTSDENANDYYYWDIAIDSAYMTQDIEYKLTENSEVLLEGKVSVKDYADAVLGNEKYSDYWDIAKALLNYGAASQNYFDVHTDDLANKDLSAEDKVTTISASELAELDQYRPEYIEPNDSFSYYGTSLILKGIIRTNMYFMVKDISDLKAVKIVKDDEETPFVTARIEHYTKSYFNFEVNYMSVYDLMDSHNYKVYGYSKSAGEYILLMNFDYSAGTYFYLFYNDYECDDAELTELMNCLYRLYLALNDY